jgi:hypothetical protein
MNYKLLRIYEYIKDVNYMINILFLFTSCAADISCLNSLGL